MKKYINFAGVLALLVFTSFSFTGCKQEGCIDPLAVNYDEEADKDDGSCIYETQLKLHLHNNFGSSEFLYGSDYELADGRKLNLSIARFYFSNIRLMNGSAETPLADVYKQWNASEEHYMLGDAPAGTYTGIKFDIGVDSTANYGDPSAWPDDHALSSSSSTHDHWSWNSGYIFMKIEGKADTSAAMNGTINGDFVYHVGTPNFARTVEIPVNFSISEGSTGEVHLEVDLMKFFDNVDLTADFDTHTMNNMPLAGAVADGIAGSIGAE